MGSDFNFLVFDSAEKVALEAAQYIAQRIGYFIEKNAICHVVLPGGTTPQRCLEHLSAMDLPWRSIHWYPGDERCYPKGHADRNDTICCHD